MKLKSPFLSRKSDGTVNVKIKKFKDHEEMANRLTKTLYYGKSPKTERPSLAMTNVAVKLFSEAIPNGGLGEIDMHYAASVSRNACVSPCSLMLALVYVDRLRHCNPDYLQTVSSSEIFLVSMMIASKFLYDEGEEDEVFNDEWAASANLETKDINKLERQFLAALDWNAYVDFISLGHILHRMESQIALQEGIKRGWFTYTDLEILSQNLSRLHCLTLFMDNIFKVAVVCAITYIAGVLTVVASTVIVHRCLLPVKLMNHLHYFSSQHGNCSEINNTDVTTSTWNLSREHISDMNCKFGNCRSPTIDEIIYWHPNENNRISVEISILDSLVGPNLFFGNSTDTRTNVFGHFTQTAMLTTSVPKYKKPNLDDHVMVQKIRINREDSFCQLYQPVTLYAR